ncbi:LysR substrate-binding domain-containing protein [Zoogloea sp.]|uniref:LysR substrate-binding domain-containing protein n=1 Tax=Zoogloea sp. TaxID=49181 RepID=UPI0025FC2AF8|nr:LysR substrate-binding domain-containing protein [Zoogloea sp.]MCK6392595.1 LysR substrate-binding domain-containing protein [Zoogloea sp.]
MTIHAPPSFAQRWLVPRLSRFNSLHPDVELRLASDVCNIDGLGRSAEGLLTDPREAGSAVAVRFGLGDYPGLCRDVLLAPAYVLVCSPALLARTGPLATPTDWGRQVFIHDESIPDEAMRPSWAEWFRLAGVANVDASRGPRFSSAVLVLEAAMGGQGLALALWPLVEADVRSGRLVMPVATMLPSRYVYSLVVPEALAGRTLVRDFRAWLLAEAEVPAALTTP